MKPVSSLFWEIMLNGNLCNIFTNSKSFVICNAHTRRCWASAEFLYGTKPREGSHSVCVKEAKFITVTDGAVSERPVEKTKHFGNDHTL